jgi:oleate hydratase
MIEAETRETSPDPKVPARPSHRPKAYLVGGGIASLAAAAFLIRDGDMRGEDIIILEATDLLGGSLDAGGTAAEGYTLRGGRMLESKYLCTFDLFSSIPTLDGKRTVTEEIFAWNRTMKTSSKSRLFRDGKRQTAPPFELSERHILNLERLVIEPEVLLGRTTIADQFDEAFFETNFWLMWSTTFAFQPWHSAVELKRYLARFVHMVTGFGRLEGIMRTVYNQYDSMVRPLLKWLGERNVDFRLGTRVVDLRFGSEDGELTVERILFDRDGARGEVMVQPGDRVLVTLGSMTEASSLGSTHSAPVLGAKPDGGAWRLWEKLAQGRSNFGRPSVFDDHVDQSKWLSFTTTIQGEGLLEEVTNLTGNVPGEGGLITFADSAWKLSIVVPHQPHFLGQPPGVSVFWGYGLAVDTVGDFVSRPMSACSGEEIMIEVLGHLGVQAKAASLHEKTVCIPCMMPFITSQFLPREKGDRPDVVPERTKNLAFLGQFCELPDDVVFTVEYSVRSAQTAVYALLELDKKPPAVYRGVFNPRVLYRAFESLHDIRRTVPVTAPLT